MNVNCVIGIDQSSTNTGVVIMSVTGEYLYAYLIQPPKKLNFEERVLYTHKIIMEIIEDIKNDLVAVGLEGVAIFSKGKVVQLAGLLGLLKYSIMNLNYKTFEFPPSSVKKFATTNGRANKDDMIEALPENVKLDFQDISDRLEDLADAYHIAKMTAEKYLKELKCED